MAVSVNDIKTNYPLPVYNYRVEIGTEAIGFSEVSGLSIEHETITYKESRTEAGVGPVAMHMPGIGTPANITLKKGYIRANSINILYGWLNSIKLNQVEKKDIYVRLLDETGAPVVTWTVINAFPKKLDVPSFDATSNEVAIETLELMADGVSMSE